MKPIRDFFRKKEKPAAEKPGFLAGLKNRFSFNRDSISIENLRKQVSGLINAGGRSTATKTVVVVAGVGLAVAGMAADVAFLGGAGTVAVASILYSDFRNAKHIKQISTEIDRIDKKIDELKTAQQPVPDYAPTLSAVKSSIEDFQASARKLPQDAADELARLKQQVVELQNKIAPPKPQQP